LNLLPNPLNAVAAAAAQKRRAVAGLATVEAPVAKPLAAGGAVVLVASDVANASGTNATSGRPANGATGATNAPPLYVDASVNGGMEYVTAPIVGAVRPGLCQYVNLSRCESTSLSELVAARGTTIAVADTTRFVIGRFIRINPGEKNEEDSQIFGFGRRLTTAERASLDLAIARNAAENAKESSVERMAQGVNVRPAYRRAGESFLEIGARSLQPSSALRRLSMRGPPSTRADPPSVLDVRLEGATSLLEEGASISTPHDAIDRVHGRALMRHINLSRPLVFAHRHGEPVIMLPESTTHVRAAPALLGANPREAVNMVHRQLEAAPPPSSPEMSEAERRARDARASPPPMPPTPPGSPPPSASDFVKEDENYVYDDGLASNSRVEADASSAKASANATASVPATSAADTGTRKDVGAHPAAVVMRLVGTVTTGIAALPFWVWIVIGGVVALLLVLCIAWRWRVARQKRRRRAQLEDVQSVFQTETWRKLE